MTPVSSNTVVGVFKDADQARSAVTELRHAGFPQDSISMVVRYHESHEGEPAPEVIKDAEIGAAAGAIGGTLFAFAAVAVPGLGPVMAIGPILGALGGASLGALTGGLIGALTNAGVPQAKAHDFAEGVRRGDAIVTVRTDAASMERALRILNEAGALSEDELRRERKYYAAGGHYTDEEPGTLWPHDEAHDIGEDLVEASAPPPKTRTP